MDADADPRQTPPSSKTEQPAAFVETTPADRAGWEEALAAEDQGTGAAAEPVPEAQPAAMVPEYEEDHPVGPSAGEDDLTIADLRPEVEGLTAPERARRRGVSE